MGRSDTVAICLMAQKAPCPNFEINTDFNYLVYGVTTDANTNRPIGLGYCMFYWFFKAL